MAVNVTAAGAITRHILAATLDASYTDWVPSSSEGVLYIVGEDLRTLATIPAVPITAADLTSLSVAAYTDYLPDVADPTLFIVDSEGNVIAAAALGGSGGGSAEPATASSLAAMPDITLDGDPPDGTNPDKLVCSVPAWFFEGHSTPKVALFVQYGQSLAIASGDTAYTTAAEYPGKVLMLNGTQGVRCISNQPFDETGITDAVEAVQSVYAESGMVAMLNAIAAKVETATGEVPYLGGIVGGAGGASIRVLGPGSATYESLLYAIQRWVTFAAEQGLGVEVVGCLGIHGNEDTPHISHDQQMRRWIQWRQNFSHDVRRLTGQVREPLLWLDQPSSAESTFGRHTGTPLAMLDATQYDPYIRSIAYHPDLPRSDGTHLTSLGYMFRGQRDAGIVFQDLWCAGAPPFRITEAWKSDDDKVQFRCTPRIPPLVLDTTGTADMDLTSVPTLGLEFDNLSGSPLTIDSIAIIDDGSASPEYGEAIVEVTFDAPLTGDHLWLLHAMRRSDVDNDAPESGFKDSSPDVSTHDEAGDPADPGRALPQYMHRQVVRVY